MIKGAIKAWILNLKTCLLSAFLQSLEKIIHSLVGFKGAGTDREAGEREDIIRSSAARLLRFKLLTAVASNPRQINNGL